MPKGKNNKITKNTTTQDLKDSSLCKSHNKQVSFYGKLKVKKYRLSVKEREFKSIFMQSFKELDE